MASAARMWASALMVVLAVLSLAASGSAQLRYGFYKGKCNASDVEAVVQSFVKARFARECAVNVRTPQLSNQAFKLLHAHDCYEGVVD